MEAFGDTATGLKRVVHRDDPPEGEARRRLEMLCHARVPAGRRVETWAGEQPDEVRWRMVA